MPLRRNNFRITPNNLRTNTELFRLSLLYSPAIPNIPKLISSIIEPLSVLPYRFGNTPDMIETPLRSMINMVLWKAMLTPMHSMKTFVVEP